MSSILKLRQICPQPKFCPETIVWTKLRVELEGTKYLFGDSDDAEHFFSLVEAPVPVTTNEEQDLDGADGSADGDLLLFLPGFCVNGVWHGSLYDF